MTYYGRWMYKFEEGARQGLKGVLIIHEDREQATLGRSYELPPNLRCMWTAIAMPIIAR